MYSPGRMKKREIETHRPIAVRKLTDGAWLISAVLDTSCFWWEWAVVNLSRLRHVMSLMTMGCGQSQQPHRSSLGSVNFVVTQRDISCWTPHFQSGFYCELTQQVFSYVRPRTNTNFPNDPEQLQNYISDDVIGTGQPFRAADSVGLSQPFVFKYYDSQFHRYILPNNLLDL